MTKDTLEEQWEVFPTADDVANEALKLILNVSIESIDAHGLFRIVLAGGTTPKKIYELLAEQPCEWEKWHLYLGDERCLPENDPERNSEMIRESLLEKIDIPGANVHLIPAEIGAEVAAKKYAEEIATQTPFNLVMLGMGEDGHTASLFPGNTHEPDEVTHAVHNSPKPPKERVSMSAQTLSNNEYLLIIVTGENKREAVSQWKRGKGMPVASITSFKNRIVMLDESAESD
ncbi:MAG: 6-phosphogluconolactonase [Cocleimonas sp.]